MADQVKVTIVVGASGGIGNAVALRLAKDGFAIVARCPGPTADLADVALNSLAAIAPPDADPEEGAGEIARVVNLPFGKRPFRVHIDPADDGAEGVNRVADRVRAEFLRRIELGDLLHPHSDFAKE